MATSSKTSRRCATGLYATAQHVTACVVTAGLRGHKIVAQQQVQVGPEGLPEAIKELDEVLPRDSRVQAAIDPRQLFSLTRKLERALPSRERHVAAHELLPPRLGAVRGGVVADAAPLKLRGGARALVVASPREPVELIFNELTARQVSRARLAPAPLALAEHALRDVRTPKGGCVVFLPGSDHGVVLLRSPSGTLAWRLIDVDADNPQVLATALMGLVDHAREDLDLTPPSHLVACVGEELRGPMEEIAERLSIELKVAPRCETTPENYALALATAGLHPELPALDLFNELRPRSNFMANFPRAAALGVAGTLAACACWLIVETNSLDAEAAALEASAGELLDEIESTPDELADLLDELQARVALAQAFVGDRIYWATPLRSLPYVVPDTLRLTDVEATDPFVDPGELDVGSDQPRQLVMSGDVALGAGEHAPPQALALTQALREESTITRGLPDITGAHIRPGSSVQGRLAHVRVACMGQRAAP